MRTYFHIALLAVSSLVCSSLAADSYQDRLEAKKQDIRSMRYARLKKQHEENLAEIERLKAELASQNSQLDNEINELQELILSQEELILELTDQLSETN